MGIIGRYTDGELAVILLLVAIPVLIITIVTHHLALPFIVRIVMDGLGAGVGGYFGRRWAERRSSLRRHTSG